MIVKKIWAIKTKSKVFKSYGNKTTWYKGLYLFGVIPLYIRAIKTEYD